MSARIQTDIGPDLPSIRELAAGAVFLRGPRALIISWSLILGLAIVSSSVGLVLMLLVVPLALFMIVVGFLWLGIRRLR